MMSFLTVFWELLLCMGIFMLIGLILVGLLHLYVPQSTIQKHMAGRGWKSVFKAALYGMPLPICSCGMIPLAALLKKSGAGNGAVTSFFITTPMTGVDSIIATYGVFGWPMALLRVLGSFISGIVAGLWVGSNEHPAKKRQSTWSTTPPQSTNHSCSCCSHEDHERPLAGWKKAMHYALNEVFSDVAGPILIGLILSAILVMVIPPDFVRYLRGDLLLSYLLVILVALPIYSCSTSTIPIAFTMLILGVAPGAVFVFLALAPTTNIITAGIYHKLLGFRALMIYLVVITGVSLAIGLMIDFVLPQELFYPQKQIGEETYNLVEKVSAVLFLLLLFYYATPLSKTGLLFFNKRNKQ